MLCTNNHLSIKGHEVLADYPPSFRTGGKPVFPNNADLAAITQKLKIAHHSKDVQMPPAANLKAGDNPYHSILRDSFLDLAICSKR
ncbi:hypothetical protein JCM13664_12950 [Methylothermus subterraneus]